MLDNFALQPAGKVVISQARPFRWRAAETGERLLLLNCKSEICRLELAVTRGLRG